MKPPGKKNAARFCCTDRQGLEDKAPVNFPIPDSCHLIPNNDKTALESVSLSGEDVFLSMRAGFSPSQQGNGNEGQT
jgi:hypothetical protein